MLGDELMRDLTRKKIAIHRSRVHRQIRLEELEAQIRTSEEADDDVFGALPDIREEKKEHRPVEVYWNHTVRQVMQRSRERQLPISSKEEEVKHFGSFWCVTCCIAVFICFCITSFLLSNYIPRESDANTKSIVVASTIDYETKRAQRLLELLTAAIAEAKSPS